MTKPLLFPDFVRASALPFIVAIHATNSILFPAPTVTVTPEAWGVALIAQSWSRPFVPLFIILSGGLLLTSTKNETAGRFFQRRWLRVGLPYLLWSGIYLGWRFLNGESLSIPQIGVMLLIGTLYYHLWFGSLILWLYCLTPVLRPLVQRLPRAGLWGGLLLWVGLLGVWPWIKFGLPAGAVLILSSSFYIGYFCLGYALWQQPLRGWQIGLLSGLILASFGLSVWGTHTLAQQTGALQLDYWVYWALHVALAAGSWFWLLQSLPWERWLVHPTALAWLQQLSAASLGIYFIHPLVLDVLAKLGLDAFTLHPFVGLPLTTLVALGLSWGLVALGQRVPGVGQWLFGVAPSGK